MKLLALKNSPFLIPCLLLYEIFKFCCNDFIRHRNCSNQAKGPSGFCIFGAFANPVRFQPFREVISYAAIVCSIAAFQQIYQPGFFRGVHKLIQAGLFLSNSPKQIKKALISLCKIFAFDCYCKKRLRPDHESNPV
jgi:hypothetical protein